jgi:hypothetical protein
VCDGQAFIARTRRNSADANTAQDELRTFGRIFQSGGYTNPKSGTKALDDFPTDAGDCLRPGKVGIEQRDFIDSKEGL